VDNDKAALLKHFCKYHDGKTTYSISDSHLCRTTQSYLSRGVSG